MKYSVIIPAYNEAPVIAMTVHALADALEVAFPNDWEIIVVDNASTDGTSEAVKALNMRCVSVLSLAEKGKGHAVRSGFTKAEGGIVGFIDADLSVEPANVVDALRAVARGDAEVVIGSRAHPESRLPSREWWRSASSSLFNLAARCIVGVHVSDTQCPLKVMGVRGMAVMLATKESTWFFDIEFIALVERLRFPIAVMPITWNEHRYPERSSKLSMSRDGLASLTAMLRIRRRLPAELIPLSSRFVK